MKKRLFCLLICLCMIFSAFPFVSATDVPTEEEAYSRILTAKANYPHGKSWTNGNYYSWKGGDGGASGCMGFAYLISDIAFGDLPARTIYPQSGKPITISDLRVGDILRLPGHSVVVLEKHSDYILTVEGNYQRKVYWGRKISAAKVKNADYYTTRYPEGYAAPAPQMLAEVTQPQIKSVAVVVNGETLQFTDIDGHWAIDNIKVCLSSGLLGGSGTASDMHFNPNGKVTRAQVVTALYRAKGSPEVSASPVFDDLTEDWYKVPVVWATENGIVNGTGDRKFSPDSEMTREAIVTVMHRFAKKPRGKAEIYGFSDSGEVSEYSWDAFSWAVGEGIISGSGNCLNPKGNATRAEFSTMIVRLSTALAKA